MSITSDELNFLVYRYLQESGFVHSAFVFAYESLVGRTNLATADIPPGALINFLQKGLQYAEIERELEQRGTGDMMNGLSLLSGSKDESVSMDLSQNDESASNAENGGESGGKTTLDLESRAKKGSDNTVVNPADVTELKGHKADVAACAWNPVCDVLASTGDASVRLWSIPRGASGLPAASSASQDCKILSAETDVDKSVKSSSILELDWRSDGQQIAAAGYDGTVRIWSLQGELVHTLSGHKGYVSAVKWNKSGNLVLTASLDKTVVVWDGVAGELKQQLEHHVAPVLDVDWRDDNTFATCSTDKLVCVCKVGTSEPLHVFRGHEDEVNKVKWDPSGQLLASCSDDSVVKLWKPESQEPVEDWREHGGSVLQIDWAPMGVNTANKQLLASSSADETVKIWDVEQSKSVLTLNGHSKMVYSVAFSPDGQFIASGSTDQTLRIWSVKDGKCVRKYKGDGTVLDLAWNKDGDKVAAGFGVPSLSVCIVDFRK